MTATPPVAVAGHSQGVLAVEALAAKGGKDVELLALAQLIGTAGTLVARRRGPGRRSGVSARACWRGWLAADLRGGA